MAWWWVSIAAVHTKRGFKGVVICEAEDGASANQKAYAIYHAAGGKLDECLQAALTRLRMEDVPAPEWRNRLVTSRREVELYLNGESAQGKAAKN